MQTVNFNYFPLVSGEVVLDIGCGEGRHAIAVYDHAPVTSIGLDLNADDLITARAKARECFPEPKVDRHLAFTQVDATKLPFASHSIDKIICSEVLEHIGPYEQVLDEIYRVLKPGGLLCVSVPRFWPEALCWHLSDAYHENDGGHIRIFLSKQLRRKIEARHFVFYKRHWAHALHSIYWWLQCAWWNKRETNRLVNAWHRLLVWDMMSKPWITRVLERLLNPVLGKSVVMYFKKTHDEARTPL